MAHPMRMNISGRTLTGMTKTVCHCGWSVDARACNAALVLAVLTLLPAGCVTAEPRQDLPLQETLPLSVNGGVPVSQRWWEDLDDPVLADSVETALAQNFSLNAAFERIRQARAVARLAGADRSLRLDATASGALRDGGNINGQSEISIGLEAAYEVDLWGRIESAIAAEQLEADATLEDYEAAAVTLSAELAIAMYRRAEAVLQLELLESQLETNRNVLTVLEERFSIGQSGSADVLRQRQLVERTLEQQILTRASKEVLEHQILVISGHPPQSDGGLLSVVSLPEVPPLPQIGLPSELLQRRPDVRAALYRIESADASVAAAVKDQYPSLSIGAALSSSAPNPSGLFDAWIASLVGQFVAPLLDGGRREAEIERQVAIRRQRLAEYGDVVLTSFREVEDALSQERHQVLRIENLARQLELARDTYAQLRSEYLNGAADFIDVLESLRDQQDLERDLLSAKLLRLEYRIALYRAIAGGLMHDENEGEMIGGLQ